jgi:thymidylate kinase
MNLFLDLFFKKLNSSGLKYCVLRNYKELPASVGTSDLDILINKDGVKSFYYVLDQVLKNVSGKIIIQYGDLTPRICIVCKNGSEWYGIQIDVHEGVLPYRTSGMFPVESVFGKASKYNDVWVADDSDADLIAFLKEILNNKKCEEQYFKDSKIAWAKNKQEYLVVLSSIYSELFLNRMETVMSGDFDPLKVKALALIGRKDLTKGWRRKYVGIISGLKKSYRFLRTPGFTIAFLGTDGAGKTTIIDSLSPSLNRSVHNALFYEHMRPNVLPNIAQIFGRKKMDGPVTNPHAKEASGILGSLLRLFYYSLDYVVGYWVKVYPVLVRKSSIWIFDRYFYDYLLDPKRARINLPVPFIKFIRVFIPKPDLILCLWTDPKEIYERKPELPLYEIEEQVLRLQTFCESEINASWVDTGGALDVTVDSAMEIIVNRMAGRYK